MSKEMYTESLTETIDSISIILEDYANNKELKTMIYLLLIFYIAIIAPKLKRNVVKYINNIYVKLICLVLIITISYYDITTAVLLSIAIIITLHTAYRLSINNTVNGIVSKINNNENINYGNTKQKNDLENNLILHNPYDVYDKQQYSEFFEMYEYVVPSPYKI